MFVIIIFNTVAFIIGARILIKSTLQKGTQGINRKNRRSTAKLIVGMCVIMILFGLGWIFGALTFNIAQEAFKYLFVIFNVFQGFYLFVFICVFGKDGRKFWIDLLKLKSFKKSLTTKSTLSNSQTVKSQRSESTTVSGKNTLLSSSGSSAGLVFKNSHEVKFELVPGKLTTANESSSACEDNKQQISTPPKDDQSAANKISIAIEETSINGTNNAVTEPDISFTNGIY